MRAILLAIYLALMTSIFHYHVLVLSYRFIDLHVANVLMRDRHVHALHATVSAWRYTMWKHRQASRAVSNGDKYMLRHVGLSYTLDCNDM